MIIIYLGFALAAFVLLCVDLAHSVEAIKVGVAMILGLLSSAQVAAEWRRMVARWRQRGAGGSDTDADGRTLLEIWATSDGARKK